MGEKGKVWIVGAGPGDIGLLTVKGLRCLKRADVIVYDYHVNAQVLNYVDRTADFVYAGKRSGRHEMTQEEINRVLIEGARAGKTVCRLKGGDPFVFGRGGEEAEALAREGIDFEVVPGVSSVIAAPAFAGIPLTHRRYASSFAVITGNEAATKKESTLSWSALAGGCDTLVFLMGVKNIDIITQRLIEAGKSRETPVAVVRWGTRPDQETVVGTLATIGQEVKERQVQPPAVLIVGSVVALRSSLQWYEKKPLFGHRILITEEYSDEYQLFEELGAEIFGFPTLRVEPPSTYAALDKAIDEINTYQWVVFPDSHAFRFFLDRYIERGHDIRDLKGLRLGALSVRAAEAIAASGMAVDLVRDESAAGSFGEALSKASGREDRGDIRLLVPSSQASPKASLDMVRFTGNRVDAPAAYTQVVRARHGKRLRRFLFEGRITVAVFARAAAFAAFAGIVGEDLGFLRNVAVAAIGRSTREVIEKAGIAVTIVPSEATASAMLEEIVRWSLQRRVKERQ